MDVNCEGRSRTGKPVEEEKRDDGRQMGDPSSALSPVSWRLAIPGTGNYMAVKFGIKM